jgi:hypothetical protein
MLAATGIINMSFVFTQLLQAIAAWGTNIGTLREQSGDG